MSDELDPDDHALIAKIRALPDEGAEPDWTAMARNIRLAVADGHNKARRRWWLFALPALAVAGAAAVLALTLRHHDEPVPVATTHPVAVEHHDSAPAVYLDGEVVDIDAIDPSALDPDEESAPPDIASDDDGLLPTDHWIDRLDDRALDHVAKILDKKKS